MRRLLLAAGVAAAVPAARLAREWVQWVTGNLTAGTGWLTELELRVQVLEGVRDPETLKETRTS